MALAQFIGGVEIAIGFCGLPGITQDPHKQKQNENCEANQE
jgi:hypothetical protein